MTHDQALMLAAAYVRLRRGERALDVLEHAVPDDALTWLWRANALHLLERYEEAVSAARTGLGIHSENPYLFAAIGRAELALLHFDKAEKALRESLRLAPYEAETHSALAALLTATKRPAEADKVSRQALSLDAENPSVRAMDVLVKVWHGRHEKADLLSKELLADAPDDPIAHYCRGLARGSWGDARGAARHYREAARLQPDNALFVKAARVSNHRLLWPARILGPIPIEITFLALFVALCFQPGHWQYVWYAAAYFVYVFVAILAMNFRVSR